MLSVYHMLCLSLFWEQWWWNRWWWCCCVAGISGGSAGGSYSLPTCCLLYSYTGWWVVVYVVICWWRFIRSWYIEAFREGNWTSSFWCFLLLLSTLIWKASIASSDWWEVLPKMLFLQCCCPALCIMNYYYDIKLVLNYVVNQHVFTLSVGKDADFFLVYSSSLVCRHIINIFSYPVYLLQSFFIFN